MSFGFGDGRVDTVAFRIRLTGMAVADGFDTLFNTSTNPKN